MPCRPALNAGSANAMACHGLGQLRCCVFVRTTTRRHAATRLFGKFGKRFVLLTRRNGKRVRDVGGTCRQSGYPVPSLDTLTPGQRADKSGACFAVNPDDLCQLGHWSFLPFFPCPSFAAVATMETQ